MLKNHSVVRPQVTFDVDPSHSEVQTDEVLLQGLNESENIVLQYGEQENENEENVNFAVNNDKQEKGSNENVNYGENIDSDRVKENDVKQNFSKKRKISKVQLKNITSERNGTQIVSNEHEPTDRETQSKEAARQYASSRSRKENCNTKKLLYICDMCNYITNVRIVFDRHKLCHVSEKLFEYRMFHCSFCIYMTCSRDSLKCHISNKHGNKVLEKQPFSCDYCFFWTSDLNSLQTHNKRKHRDMQDNQLFECDSCNYRCADMDVLKCHKLVHADESCDTLNKCDHENLLKKHTVYKCVDKKLQAEHPVLKPANGKQPFSCNSCLFWTSDYDSLQFHNNREHSESTSDTVNVSNSIKTYLDKPLFECDSCDYMSKSAEVAQHICKNADTQSYKCHDCDYKCVQLGDLMVHIEKEHNDNENSKTSTEEKYFKCIGCGYKSDKLDRLQQHVKSSHIVIHSSNKKL